jgi:hypothetical protein
MNLSRIRFAESYQISINRGYQSILPSLYEYTRCIFHWPRLWITSSILRLLLFLTSLAWHCENFFPSFPPSYPLHYCSSTPVELGYGVDLFEGNYLLLLPAVDLRMDPASRPRPVSSVPFAYLGNTSQLCHSIEQRYI